MDAQLVRIEAVAARLEAVAARMGGGGADDGDVPFWVTDYENIVKNEVAAAVKATNELGIPKCGGFLATAYDNTLELIRRVPNTKKPSPKELMEFLGPASQAIGDSDNNRYKGKDFKKYGDHYKAMYEATLLCSWVTLAPPQGLPAQHCDGQMQSCDFNVTRVQRKDKDAKTKAWIAAMKALNKKVATYVKANFKSGGLTWNPKGSSLASAAAVSSGPTAGGSNTNSTDDQKTSGSAAKSSYKKKKPAASAGMGSVFAQLNKGTGITKGMKKVKKSQKTKYRADRSGKVTMKSKTKTRKKYGPPACAFKGGRWMIENYDEGVVEVSEPTLKQNLFISMCDNCTINVTAPKVKAVCIESCVKVRIFLTDVVSSVEMVNCKSVTLVLQGVTPSVSVDKCESAGVVLLKASYAEPPVLITSNISAMNVTLPGATESDDSKNIPIPEQFMSHIDNETGTIVTKATEH